MPNIYNISPQAWDNYFIKREEIGKVFCRYLRNSSFKSTNWYHFFQNLRPKYENFCVKQADKSYIFSEDFLSPDEVKFHNWIEDALSPGIKFETFKYLARNNTDLDQARRSILEEEAHKPNNLIGKALLELFNYEPAEH
jgi:hypothetical protein